MHTPADIYGLHAVTYTVHIVFTTIIILLQEMETSVCYRINFQSPSWESGISLNIIYKHDIVVKKMSVCYAWVL